MGSSLEEHDDFLIKKLQAVVEEAGGVLAPGWVVQAQQRKSGKFAGKFYKYFISPDQRRFRSTVEVLSHLGLSSEGRPRKTAPTRQPAAALSRPKRKRPSAQSPARRTSSEDDDSDGHLPESGKPRSSAGRQLRTSQRQSATPQRPDDEAAPKSSPRKLRRRVTSSERAAATTAPGQWVFGRPMACETKTPSSARGRQATGVRDAVTRDAVLDSLRKVTQSQTAKADSKPRSPPPLRAAVATAGRKRAKPPAEEQADAVSDVDWDGDADEQSSSESDDSSAAESDDQSSSESDDGWIEAPTHAARPRKGAARPPVRRRAAQGGGEWAKGLGDDAGPAVRLEGLPPLQVAQAQLTLGARPATLPCRDAEKAAITAFVEDCLRADPAAANPRPCLYIAGVPGTGKTATVLEVMKAVAARAEAGSLPRFRFAEINALRLQSAQHAYTELLAALTGVRKAPAGARGSLQDLFSGSGRPPGSRVTVVLMDEIDMLATRDQSVLYNLFGWPLEAGARLAIIGVANTLDLPERLLPRIASRLGSSKVVFEPYNKEQIKTIIKNRLLSAPGVCSEQAIELTARKVSSVNGDVRRALEVLRRAAEMVELEQGGGGQEGGAGDAGGPGAPPEQVASGPPRAPLVTPHFVTRVFQEMFNAVHMQVIQGLSDLHQVFLASLLLDSRYSGVAECTLANVAARLATLWATGQKAHPLPACHPDSDTPAAPPHAVEAPATSRSPTGQGGPITARSADDGGGCRPAAFGAAAEAPGAPENACGYPNLPPGAALGVVRTLEAMKLVMVSQAFARWDALVSLNVPLDDVLHVLRQNPRLHWLHASL